MSRGADVIEGISHLTFVVRDLDRMEEILTSVIGAERVYDSGEATFSISRERFYLAGGVWLAIMEGAPLGERSYNHTAFKIADAAFDDALRRIETLGLEIKPGRDRVTGEGRSVYFYDHDNHLFELHTGTLAQRLERYRRGR